MSQGIRSYTSSLFVFLEQPFNDVFTGLNPTKKIEVRSSLSPLPASQEYTFRGDLTWDDLQIPLEEKRIRTYPAIMSFRYMQIICQIPKLNRTPIKKKMKIQSGLSSRAKHGGTVFSAISGSIKDLTTVPGSYNHLGP